MIGSILGDIAGSIYEFNENREEPKKLFVPSDEITDDTVMNIALMRALVLYNYESRILPTIKTDEDRKNLLLRHYKNSIWGLTKSHPNPMGGYGFRFRNWLNGGMNGNSKSKGNGAAMNLAPIGFLCNTDESAEWFINVVVPLTHDDPESIRAAKCLVECIIRARNGMSQNEIMDYVTFNYYPMDFGSYERLQREYKYTELVEDTVPQAIYCALTSNSLEDAISRAISIGGDADTLGAICGGLAEALYPINKVEDGIRYLNIMRNAGMNGRDFRYLNAFYTPLEFTPEKSISGNSV